MKLSSAAPRGPPAGEPAVPTAILTMELRVLLSKKESLSDRSNLLKYWAEREARFTGVGSPGFAVPRSCDPKPQG